MAIKYSDTCVQIVKKFEGLHKVQADGTVKAYRCPAGKWTIGYGHTKGVRSGQTISKDEAEQLLRDDLDIFNEGVLKLVTVPLNQSQLDALVSWAFNLGLGNLKSSTLLRRLNKGDYASIPAQMVRWNKARVGGKLKVLEGLVRRRAAEAALFAMENETGDIKPQVQKVAVPSRNKPLTKSRTLWGAVVGAVATTSGIVLSETEIATIFSVLPPQAAGLATLAGLGVVMYARIDDHLKGK